MLGKGVPRPVGLIPCNFFVLHIKVVCFIFVFVKNCLFLYLSQGGKKSLWFNPLCFFVLHHKIVCYIFMFVNNFCLRSQPKGH